jgi:hypothetical protein
MLNKKESLLRRDQAVSWLWACRKVGFNRDVARLIASHVFDGFKYLNGVVNRGPETLGIHFENGRLVPQVFESWSKRITYCHTIIRWLTLFPGQFYLNGRATTMDETEAVLEVLKRADCCGVYVLVERDTSTTVCKTFGDVLPLGRLWECSRGASETDGAFHIYDMSSYYTDPWVDF